MADSAVFQRYEYKYLLTRQQQKRVLAAMETHMEPDPYSHSSIRNIYYDTPDYRLIRTSMMQPMYKEKLRLRSYGRAGWEDPVFVELKKKYDSVVYKRRLRMPSGEAMLAMMNRAPMPDCQIGRELGYAVEFYASLRGAVFLSYERDSFRGIEDGDFRVTFDDEIRYRTESLTLDSEPWGNPILPKDLVLMELKLARSMPMWMARTLSDEGIYKVSFSKYGSAYADLLRGNLKGVQKYA